MFQSDLKSHPACRPTLALDLPCTESLGLGYKQQPQGIHLQLTPSIAPAPIDCRNVAHGTIQDTRLNIFTQHVSQVRQRRQDHHPRCIETPLARARSWQRILPRWRRSKWLSCCTYATSSPIPSISFHKTHLTSCPTGLPPATPILPPPHQDAHIWLPSRPARTPRLLDRPRPQPARQLLHLARSQDGRLRRLCQRANGPFPCQYPAAALCWTYILASKDLADYC